MIHTENREKRIQKRFSADSTDMRGVFLCNTLYSTEKVSCIIPKKKQQDDDLCCSMICDRLSPPSVEEETKEKMKNKIPFCLSFSFPNSSFFFFPLSLFCLNLHLLFFSVCLSWVNVSCSARSLHSLILSLSLSFSLLFCKHNKHSLNLYHIQEEEEEDSSLEPTIFVATFFFFLLSVFFLSQA